MTQSDLASLAETGVRYRVDLEKKKPRGGSARRPHSSSGSVSRSQSRRRELTKELFVDLDTCQIGTLDEENGSLRFRYEDSYRNDPSEIP